MKKLLASIPVAVLAVAMALAAVKGVGDATAHISQIGSLVWRAVATLAEFIAGTLWLLATVFFSTRLAVLIFRESGGDEKQSP